MTWKERIGYYFPQFKNGDFVRSISATGLKVKKEKEYLPFTGMCLNCVVGCKGFYEGKT